MPGRHIRVAFSRLVVELLTGAFASGIPQIKTCWNVWIREVRCWYFRGIDLYWDVLKTWSNIWNLQVCNLAWCKNVNELVSTHGYSQNQIMVWKYPSLGKVCYVCVTYIIRVHLQFMWKRMLKNNIITTKEPSYMKFWFGINFINCYMHQQGLL